MKYTLNAVMCQDTCEPICFKHGMMLLTYAHRSQWSIGHQRPPAIALCSGLLLSFQTSCSPAVSALLQRLASNCCEAGLSSSSVGPYSLIGHTLSKPASSTTRQALTWNPQGKRKRGRPRNSWRRDADAEFGSHADSSRCPDVFEHDESCSCLADSGCDVSVCASLLVNHTSQVDERPHLPYGLSTNCDWCVGSCVHLHQLSLPSVDLEPCPC